MTGNLASSSHSGTQTGHTGQANKPASSLQMLTLNVVFLSLSGLIVDADAPLSDYSYKEFLGVKVDKPASLKERQEARARIAKYYNVDPQKVVSTIHGPTWTHITVPSPGEIDLPPNFGPIKNFRIFKVLVRLSEHAIGTSYHFNLYYKQELVGSVTVFAREDNSPCKACAVRRSAASIVRGVITIPSRIINDIMVHSSVPQSKKTMNDTVALIAQAFSGKLVDQNGNPFASAQGGAGAAPVPAGQAAPRTIHPAEVALLSSAVAEHANDKNQPVHFFDWKRHVDLFPVRAPWCQPPSPSLPGSLLTVVSSRAAGRPSLRLLLRRTELSLTRRRCCEQGFLELYA